jgi:hypothetical protein
MSYHDDSEAEPSARSTEGYSGGPVSGAGYVWPAAVGSPAPGAKFYAADCSQVTADIAFLRGALGATNDSIAVTDWETEMSVNVPSMEKGDVTSTTEPLAIIIRTGRTITSDSDSLAPLTIANAAMSEVRHECGTAANAGNSGGNTTANGDASGNAPGDDSGAGSGGGTTAPSSSAAVPLQGSQLAPSPSPSAAQAQPGPLTITCKVISGGAQLHATQPLNNTPVVLEFSSGWEGVVTAGSGTGSAFVSEPAAAGASSCKATPDSGDSD